MKFSWIEILDEHQGLLMDTAEQQFLRSVLPQERWYSGRILVISKKKKKDQEYMLADAAIDGLYTYGYK